MCVVPPKRRLPQGSAGRSTRRTGCAGFTLAPAAARRRSRRVFRKIMEIHKPKFGPHRHNGSPPPRDALTRFGKVQRAIVKITHGAW